jgi:phosphate transport system substrate-binding protein
MLKKLFCCFALSVFSMSAFFTGPSFARQDNSLQIKGSDTMVNLVQAWSEAFMTKNQDAFVAVTGGGSGTGLAALINGSCDIAASSREIKKEEIGLAEKKNIHPKEFKVALDGLAVAVHPENPISKLSLGQLADIFTGKIKNWNEVGGKDSKIVILSREVNSGTHVYFKEHVLRKGDPKSKEEFSPEALLMPSSQAIVDEIAQNPSAIGYFGMGYIGKKNKALSVAKDASGEAVYPTVDNVVSNKYPISRPLFVYTNGEPQGKVKAFVDFILSDDGQAIVPQIDFVPIKKK